MKLDVMSWRKILGMKALENSGNHVSINLGNGEVVFITKQNGKLFGINGICSHLKCILGNVAEDGKHVVCPCHNASFELDTGKMVKPPFIAPELPMEKYTLKTYNLREQAGFIEIEE
ncbi:sulredoxin [Ferroplasma sp.]|uniref:sulredoxin n=1 Tax=Ferroplasma sp. TaxID=2591003 RepID=UPI00262A8A0F|nr:sulredoxin [Ferroplasma sp.]MCL4453798.1 Rieske (2Fe-2S) protein [Candidatus Thermoplasmatota archaeon]